MRVEIKVLNNPIASAMQLKAKSNVYILQK